MNKKYYGYESRLHMEAAFKRQQKLAELDDYKNQKNVKKVKESDATLDTDELPAVQCEQDRE